MKTVKKINVTFLTLLAIFGTLSLGAQETRCSVGGGRYGTQQACENAGGTWNAQN